MAAMRRRTVVSAPAQPGEPTLGDAVIRLDKQGDAGELTEMRSGSGHSGRRIDRMDEVLDGPALDCRAASAAADVCTL